ncbi:MAG: DNA repair protein RecN [Acidobacteria bacterium]|nr:DNA repair protein RecN [Acidobacteriota bacterium]
MLRLLRIRNFALIRELEMEFDEGLNLLTGETGSGKSILVDAFGMLIGNRSSQDMIRSGCDSAVIEGMFEMEPANELSRILADAGFENEENRLLIRREISASGRSRVFIDGHLATLNLLKTIGERLADIHGQQDQKSLLDLSAHLEWLDYYGDNGILLSEVRRRYKLLRETAGRLLEFEANKEERLRRIEILRFQLEEIRRIAPLSNEREDLEREIAVLSNSEKIMAAATEAYSVLYESESSILAGMRRLERLLQELERFDGSWTQHGESLKECLFRAEDIALAARDYAARCDFSPERLEQAQQRLLALDRLSRKYCVSGGDIFQYTETCRQELENLTASADASAGLEKQLEALTAHYLACARQLSEKRTRDASKLEKEIRKEFFALAMPEMKLEVYFQGAKDDAGDGLIHGSYGLHGLDNIEFLIAPNKGEAMRPLARIASGGELSRLMLAIKSICGDEDRGKTLVFDEVDAGIGGRVAEAVGRRLQKLSKNNQVLCVTHWPQIAAFARTHFSVQKREADNRTETVAHPLSREERITEISRMLAGEIITETTRRHAEEMLEGTEGEVQ